MTIPDYVPLTQETPDEELALVAQRFGYHVLACLIEELDPDQPHNSLEFREDNPYVHQAIRNEDVKAIRDRDGAVKFAG